MRKGPGINKKRTGSKSSFYEGFVCLHTGKQKNGTLYVGVTTDFVKRIYQHKSDVVDGFTKKYHVHDLVYFELFDDIREAIEREKQIKRWKRRWKMRLIEEANPQWKDLYDELIH